MISTNKLRNSLVMIALLFSGLVLAVAETNAIPEGPAPAAVTAPVDPITMLRGVTDNVLHALKENKSELNAKSKKIYDVADQYILPYVDFNEMSTWVAGRTAWGKASESEKAQFISAFKILVVRTYATALNSYSNETVEFGQQKIDTSKNRVQVTSWIKRPNKENIRLDYRLIKHGNSWLVYDVVIEGVSILQGFQAQFTDKIRQQGLQKVIGEIQVHNKKGDV